MVRRGSFLERHRTPLARWQTGKGVRSLRSPTRIQFPYGARGSLSTHLVHGETSPSLRLTRRVAEEFGHSTAIHVPFNPPLFRHNSNFVD